MDAATLDALDLAAPALRAGDLADARRMRDLAGLLADRDARARCEATLLAVPAFAAAYARRGELADDPVADPDAPAGSLAHEYDRFAAWYELQPGFFPAPAIEQASPLLYAAARLAHDHDLYHVLGEYETSDRDEVALQSFLCGQAPLVFAAFIAAIEDDREALGLSRFKHLRDLLDCELDREALARGRAARPLVVCDLRARPHAPVADLRRALAIAPRPRSLPAAQFRNTCGGRSEAPYFPGNRGESHAP